MKVVHVCLACFYIDDYSYQENILPKYHKRLGYDVSIVASLLSFDKSGDRNYLTYGTQYINTDGIPVTRIDYKKKGFVSINRFLRIYNDTYKVIAVEKPDIIFIHGCQFWDINKVVRYLKKNPKVKVYFDNHADFENSARNWFSRNILHKIIWRRCAKVIEPYSEKIYGVLPARVDFLIDVYKMPQKKVEILLMGADDDEVAKAEDEKIRKAIRKQNKIKDEDILIMTGGKIDHNKLQIMLLMKAIKDIKRDNIKLLVFGSVVPKYKERFTELLCDNVQHLGWIDAKDTYKFFYAADLIVFPGLHSVFWEQVVGMGKPAVFKFMNGCTHVDLGGNCKFLYEDSVEEIKKVICRIIDNKKVLENMKNVAMTKGIEEFSYKKIAQKSISPQKL